jgi:hypothetical protein
MLTTVADAARGVLGSRTGRFQNPRLYKKEHATLHDLGATYARVSNNQIVHHVLEDHRANYVLDC